MEDKELLNGLKAGGAERRTCEKTLYNQYYYFVNEGCKKFSLPNEDSFSAYSDSVLSFIINVTNDRFDGKSSIKTYLFQIFSNKCIDLVRKSATNKQKVNKTLAVTEMLNQLPSGVYGVIEKLIDNELLNTVQQKLGDVGSKCKEILLLFEDGYSDREIAEQLNYNTPAVAKTTRLRCLEKLRESVHNTIKKSY